MPDGVKLAEFTAWCQKNISGDEMGQAQIFLAYFFQGFGQPVHEIPDAPTDRRLI